MNLSGLGQAFNSFLSRMSIPDWLKGFLQLYGEEAYKGVTEEEVQERRKRPRFTRRELKSLLLSLTLVSLVFGFVEANGLPRFLHLDVLITVVPAALLSVGLVIVAEEFFEAIASRLFGIWGEFRLWALGTLAFLVSGLLFLTPFSTPGRAMYEGRELPNKTKGLLVVGKMLLLLSLTLPFSAVFMAGFPSLGDLGLLITLMTVSYLMVPLPPMDGKTLFGYSKGLWAGVFLPSIALFYLWSVHVIPPQALVATGIVSIILFPMVLLKATPARGASCPSCGSRVKVDQQFCGQCGKELV